MWGMLAATAIKAGADASKAAPVMPGVTRSSSGPAYVTVDGLTVNRGPETWQLAAGAAAVAMVVWIIARK